MSDTATLSELGRVLVSATDVEPEPLGVGLHPGLSMADYLAHAALSASGLERLRRSPLQFAHWRTTPEARKPHLDIGCALHTAILEPHLFAASYVEGPEGDGRTKAVQDAKRELARAFPHATVLPGPSAAEGTRFVDVIGMRDRVLSHPRARTLFEGAGEVELTGIFDDPETGVRMKIRPDRLIRRARMLVDIKTTADAAPWAFPSDAERWGYFRKLVVYHRGLRVLGWPRDMTAILAVEKRPPWDLLCYMLDENDDRMAHAADEVTRLLVQYRECAEKNEWPSYSAVLDGFTLLRRPGWATRDYEEGL